MSASFSQNIWVPAAGSSLIYFLLFCILFFYLPQWENVWFLLHKISYLMAACIWGAHISWVSLDLCVCFLGFKLYIFFNIMTVACNQHSWVDLNLLSKQLSFPNFFRFPFLFLLSPPLFPSLLLSLHILSSFLVHPLLLFPSPPLGDMSENSPTHEQLLLSYATCLMTWVLKQSHLL